MQREIFVPADCEVISFNKEIITTENSGTSNGD